MKKLFIFIAFLTLFLFLTILSQIGGIVLVITLTISKFVINKPYKYKTFILFLLIYGISTVIIIPSIAPLFGRQKIINTSVIKPTSIITIILNRNYIVPSLNSLLKNTEKELLGTGIEIQYLDANFPFFDQFPLLPHLSHNDGKKLDVSLIYQYPNGKTTNKKKSNSGYGVFENPTKNEINTTDVCKSKGYYQYEYSKYLKLGMINKELIYSNDKTKILLKALLKNKQIQKVFLEPHLVKRMHINDDRIRYQGCHSVRHDDHIHIQIK